MTTLQPGGLWTPPLVRALLHGRLWKFDRHPWPEWFAAHGGVEAVLSFIHACPIPVQLQALLRGLLEEPGQSRDYYAAMVGLHPVTVSEHVRKLAVLLAVRLNQWDSTQPVAPIVVEVLPLQVVRLHELAHLEREIGGAS